MAQRTHGIHAVLSAPWAYIAFQNAVGARRSRKRLVEELIRPSPGEWLLDVGCGTGDILEFLPDLQYVGIDLSTDYIAAARQRFGSRAEFQVASVDALALERSARFDIVIAIGLLHHLDDIQVEKLLAGVRQLLRCGGRLITCDGTFVPKQNPIARALIRCDRGMNIRTPDASLAIASKHFPSVRAHVRTDLLRIPYTHLIMECIAG